MRLSRLAGEIRLGLRSRLKRRAAPDAPADTTRSLGAADTPGSAATSRTPPRALRLDLLLHRGVRPRELHPALHRGGVLLEEAIVRVDRLVVPRQLRQRIARHQERLAEAHPRVDAHRLYDRLERRLVPSRAVERQPAQDQQLGALAVALERLLEEPQRGARAQPLEVDAREIAARRHVRRVGRDLLAQLGDAAERPQQHPRIGDPSTQDEEQRDRDEHRRVVDRPVREQDGEVVDPVVAHGRSHPAKATPRARDPFRRRGARAAMVAAA